MDIMSLFRGAPNQVQQAVPGAPQNQAPTGVVNPGQPLPGTQNTPNTAPNGVVPFQDPNANPGNPGEPNPNVSPLDKHKDIWDTVKVEGAAPDLSWYGNIDPTKVLESARKVDFTKSLSPDILAKIQAGGPEAAAAFISALNGVAQTVYANSAIAATKIAEQGLNKSQERFSSMVPGMVRKLSANEGLRTDNPIFSNPAIAPLVEAMSSQFASKNPNATAAEIQTQVSDYFASIGSVFAPKAPDTPETKRANQAAKSQDWSAFLE